MPQGMQFDDISELTGREIQMTLREVDTKDLAIALLDSGEKLQDRIFGNMSERVGGMIKEEMEGRRGAAASEVEEVRGRILKTIQQLMEAGQIRWPKAKEEGGTSAKKDAYEPIKPELEKAVQTPLAHMSFDDITEMYVELAGIARREGILALERLVSPADSGDKMLVQGLRLATDGTVPELIQSMLDCRASGLLRSHKMKYKVICEGILSIYSGDNPFLIDQKLCNITLEDKGTLKQESYETFKQSFSECPCSQRDADGMREVIVGMAHIARKSGGLKSLEEFVDMIDEPLFVLGLRMAIERDAIDVMRGILGIRMSGALHALETKYRMVATGIRLIQAGTKGEAIGEKLRCFYAE